MLVTFKTDSYANIVMFGDAAEALLKMLGQSGNIPGAIMADDVPRALADLQAALKVEEATAIPDAVTSDANQDANQDEDDQANKVALATRAVPLIELLEAAIKSNDNVQWDQ